MNPNFCNDYKALNDDIIIKVESDFIHDYIEKDTEILSELGLLLKKQKSFYSNRGGFFCE